MSSSIKVFWSLANALNSIKEVIVSFQDLKKCQGQYFKKNCFQGTLQSTTPLQSS